MAVLVYNAIKTQDYDQASEIYLNLIYKRICEGAIADALLLSRSMFEFMVDDESLYGLIPGLPQNLAVSRSYEENFLGAICALYSRNYSLALNLAETLMGTQWENDALYIKARAFVKIGRIQDANEANNCLTDNLGDAIDKDARILYEGAFVNKLLGVKHLDIMIRVVELKKKYDKAILAVRSMAKDLNVKIELAEEDNALIHDFVSDKSNEEFALNLKNALKYSPQSVNELVDKIKKMKEKE